MKTLRYAEHKVTIKDTLAVVRALRTGDIASGEVVRDFEIAVEDFIPVKHAVACSSGTAALHLAMMAAGVEAGDNVLTTPNSFVASANCASYMGANLYFADIDFATGCIDADDVAVICRTLPIKAIVVVDYAGVAAQVHKIRLNVPQDTVIIEDACHAIGGNYRDMHMPSRKPLPCSIGGAHWADMTVFSFHASKVITTGEGGMVVTHGSLYAEKLRLLRTHGMQNNYMTELGYNYRMTDIQAALGLSQFKRLPEIKQHRSGLVEYYNEALRDLLFVYRVEPYVRRDRLTLCWHLMPIRVKWDAYETTRDRVRSGLLKNGIGTQVHYKPIPLQPYYGEYSKELATELWPQSMRHWEQELTLPLHSRMNFRDVEKVVYFLRRELGV